MAAATRYGSQEWVELVEKLVGEPERYHPLRAQPEEEAWWASCLGQAGSGSQRQAFQRPNHHNRSPPANPRHKNRNHNHNSSIPIRSSPSRHNSRHYSRIRRDGSQGYHILRSTRTNRMGSNHTQDTGCNRSHRTSMPIDHIPSPSGQRLVRNWR
jgi:hypothetical protein